MFAVQQRPTRGSRYPMPEAPVSLAREDELDGVVLGPSPVPPDALGPLARQGAELLDWVSTDGERAARFLAAPVRTLEEAGFALDPELRAALRRWRQGRSTPPRPLDPET